MSEKKPNTNVKAATGIRYRNIKKDYNKFASIGMISSEKHLELTGYNSAKIVDDRPKDWFEIAQVDADKVGLANVLLQASKLGLSKDIFKFKDEEAVDGALIGDPMSPQNVKASVDSLNSNKTKLDNIAKELGLSVDELISKFMDGSISEVIAAKVNNTKEKEGESNE